MTYQKTQELKMTNDTELTFWDEDDKKFLKRWTVATLFLTSILVTLSLVFGIAVLWILGSIVGGFYIAWWLVFGWLWVAMHGMPIN